MAAPRFEIADLIARYCIQLGEMGIRVERALLLAPMPVVQRERGATLTCSLCPPIFQP